jgi:hypothetical protein
LSHLDKALRASQVFAAAGPATMGSHANVANLATFRRKIRLSAIFRLWATIQVEGL